MDIFNWIYGASDVVGVISCAAPVAVLVYCLWGKRRSSVTLALALFGVLVMVGGLTHLCDVLMYWWSVPWLAAVVKGACAAASVGFSYALARVIPRAVAFRDFEQLAAAAADLRQSRQRFERAVVGSSSGLWEWYIDANEVWFSPRFKELLGYSDDEFANTFENWESALHPDDKERTLAALKSHLNQQGAYDVDYRLLTKAGTYRWFTARGVAIHGRDGRPDLLSGSIQDIHDGREAERNLRRQSEYLVQKQKLASMGELAGEVAHEFNNVLQALSGQIQFAESTLAQGSATRKELDVASLLIDEAVQFTRQLLDFSRPHPCELQPISVDDCLNRLNSVLCPLLSKTIELQFSRGDGIGLVLADTNSLQQALLNLCINARDAMPEGGTLTIATSRTELRERDTARLPGANPGSYVLITVADTGRGMSQEELARIFEPFFTTKDSGKGTGLGLAIVYSVVKKLRGMIYCESQPGHGSKFSIWLPIVSHPSDRRNKNSSTAPIAKRCRRETILYAEDDRFTRRATCRLLRKQGYRLIAARNGLDAVRLFDRYKQDIDIAVLDVVMPKMGGDEVFLHLRTAQPTLPVIVYSGNVPQRMAADMFQSEYTWQINKPFTNDVLLNAVQNAVVSRDSLISV